ncbi:MAG: hypothetical protein ACF8QF_02210 [Phycisphaerales bacterium]
MRPRRRLTPARLRTTARRRALAGALLVVGAASAWVATDRAADGRTARGWEAGFIRETGEGELLEWIPPPGAEQVAGGFTDWSPALRYAGQPLPDDVGARWTFEYDYKRVPIGRAAPVIERAMVRLVIADPNFAPFAAGTTDRFEPVVRAALERRARDASQIGEGPSGLALTLAVLPAQPGAHQRASIYWSGLPRQLATALAACIGGATLLAAIRPVRRARVLARTRTAEACPRCLYDTSASADRCPECAQPLLPPEPAA